MFGLLSPIHIVCVFPTINEANLERRKNEEEHFVRVL